MLFFIIAIAILAILLLIANRVNARRSEKNSSGIPGNIHSKTYRQEIVQNTPQAYQRELQYLYESLDQLNAVIQRVERTVSDQTLQATSNILEKAKQAEQQIAAHWKKRSQQADFYYYIGLHYTSFTLADSLTRELEALRKSGKAITELIDTTQKQINSLGELIRSARRADMAQIKAQHKELCKKCDALRNTRKICNQQITVVKDRRDRQNQITGQRRDYIGNHFGRKGRIWRAKIMARHQR